MNKLKHSILNNLYTYIYNSQYLLINVAFEFNFLAMSPVLGLFFEEANKNSCFSCISSYFEYHFNFIIFIIENISIETEGLVQ